MMEWLREYNLADVVPFVESVKKTRRQYYDDEIDILKDALGIPGCVDAICVKQVTET